MCIRLYRWALIPVLAACTAFADDPPPLDAILEKPVSFAFQDTPIRDAISFLVQAARCPVVTDPSALAEPTPVTLVMDRAPLREALDRALGPKLAWAKAHGVVVIGTPDRIAQIEPHCLMLYDARDIVNLASADGAERDLARAATELTELVRGQTDAGVWRLVLDGTKSSAGAGPAARGVLAHAETGLVWVLHGERVHRRVERLMAGLRADAQAVLRHLKPGAALSLRTETIPGDLEAKAVRSGRAVPPAPTNQEERNAADAAVRDALGRRIKCAFEGATRADALAFMRAVTGQTIRVLNAPAKDMECGVNAVLASVPAGDVLHLILTPDLTYVVADGVIQVVTPERAQDLEGRVQRIYDVMDLAAHPARADRLLVTLRALAAPETFGPGPAPADAPSLSFPDKGLLRVEAAPSVHARIEGALLAMRETPERQFHVQVWLASVADCARPVPAGGRGTDADEMNVLTRGRHALSCTTFEGRETRIEAAGARLTVRVYAADGRRLMVRAELVPEPGQTPVRAYIAIPDGEAYLVAADDPTGPKRVMAVRPTVLRPDVAMDGPPAPPAR